MNDKPSSSGRHTRYRKTRGERIDTVGAAMGPIRLPSRIRNPTGSDAPNTFSITAPYCPAMPYAAPAVMSTQDAVNHSTLPLQAPSNPSAFTRRKNIGTRTGKAVPSKAEATKTGAESSPRTRGCAGR